MTRHYPAQTRGTKTCTKCGETKPKAAFYKDRKARDGRMWRCGVCVLAIATARRKANPDAARLAWMKAHVKRKYGLTWDDYMIMYENQAGGCAICGTKYELLETPGLHVDHCHTNGHVRGLLCQGCNMGLGAFRESIPAMETAIEYLKKDPALPDALCPGIRWTGREVQIQH